MTWLIHTSSQPSSDEAGKNGIARRRTLLVRSVGKNRSLENGKAQVNFLLQTKNSPGDGSAAEAFTRTRSRLES